MKGKKMGHGGQHHVKPDTNPTGNIPASAIAPDSADSMYLFKMGQQAMRHNTNATAMYCAVLGGTLAEVQQVMAQSVANNQTYINYDPATYTGQCKAAVEAFYAAHPKAPKATR